MEMIECQVELLLQVIRLERHHLSLGRQRFVVAPEEAERDGKIVEEVAVA